MKSLMQGNEACALGAIAAGCRFFGGYPITPSSEIAEYMAVHLPRHGGVFIQMEDEIASMGSIVGASLAGRKSMTATSGPGFSLMQENIGFACIAEVPVVIANVMRGGPSTGLPTLPSQGDVMQARWGTHGDHAVVAFCPSSVEEAYHLTIRAFDVAEALRVPTMILMDEVIGHMREVVDLPHEIDPARADRPLPDGPPEEYLPFGDSETDPAPLAPFAGPYRYHVTGLTHDGRGYPTSNPVEVDRCVRRLVAKVESRTAELTDWEGVALEDADLVIVAYGAVARCSRRAVADARAAGHRVGALILRTLWPFPEQLFKKASVVPSLGYLVPEMNLGQIGLEVQRAVAGRAPVALHGKVDGTLITPGELAAAVGRIFA
jgi:2-oxoglutarate ferredoxin oxidoreductase subunit alpha